MQGPLPNLSVAVTLIKTFEGFRSEPYEDQRGIWTIGYGTTRYPNGVYVSSHDPAISELEAEQYLFHDLEPTAIALWQACQHQPTPNQFGALCSIAYNEGVHAILTSTLFKYFNAENIQAASSHFSDWIYVRINGQLVPDTGLESRRNAEKAVFLQV